MGHPETPQPLSILLPAGCTTSCLFQHPILALRVHCTASSPKTTRAPPVPTQSPLCHRRDELVVSSSCAITQQPIWRSQKHLLVSPRTDSPCPHTGEGDKAVCLSLPDWRAPKTDGQRSRAPAEPLQSHGATAGPCRCHFVTSPGWFVVMNQHFPSSQQRGASPKYMKGKEAHICRQRKGNKGCTSSTELFVAEPELSRRWLEPGHSRSHLQPGFGPRTPSCALCSIQDLFPDPTVQLGKAPGAPR